MKKVLVVGLGVSGMGAASLLHFQGKEVFGFDDRITTVPDWLILCSFETIPWNSLDLVVVSPGIASTHPVLQKAEETKKEVIGEMEFGLRHLKQPALGITGTNGKTTVTLLTEHLLKTAGMKARALGNVGTSLSSYLIQPDLTEILVLELSSYQLETCQAKVFTRGIILNITPDHLDRYASMEEYAKAKCRLQECLNSSGQLFVHASILEEYSHLLKANYETFGFESDGDYVTSFEEAKKGEKKLYSVPSLYAKEGKHQLENLLSAWILCESFNLSKEQFLLGLQTFKKPAHRIEFIGEKNGITFYDDSKGTNLDAVVQAVKTMTGPVILIAGGVDKGASYAPWKTHFAGKVKKLCVIGEAALKIKEELHPEFTTEENATLEEAVKRAIESAKPGDTILLSPGCASFDMFSDYAHRGKEFQRCVRQYMEGKV